ncbi:capsular polysaccharide biosynthesis protein [Cupriavidus sp. 2TAF22]|uniref:capsular polysaccharide biosynthesis protein n=1 Tax=unclassified Cupriavidus TaxID=2640874 RepID=UPI003F8F835C
MGIVSPGILMIPHLAAFLGKPCRAVLRRRHETGALAAVAGWGRRPSAQRAVRLARELELPYLALEDGFLRSVAPGSREAPLSLVVDEAGIYYDARQPSQLELLIRDTAPDQPALAEAQRGLALVVRHRLSKYNHAPVFSLPPRSVSRRVLVVDQTHGDMSVLLGGADAETFAAMLRAALDDDPGAEVWVKTHPEVVSGHKAGYLAQGSSENSRIRWLARDCCPLSLIEQFDRVYVVTSHMGFEALMLGKSVVCFGKPWYAGWGLTDDRHPEGAALRARRAGRDGQRPLAHLFLAAYLRYARYAHPVSGRPATLFDAIEWLARNKAANEQCRGTFYCVGMSAWKRAMVRRFLDTPSSRLKFARDLAEDQIARLPAGARLVVWGSRNPALRAYAAAAAIPVLRVEDGFVRSAGLGSDLHGPLSLALDGPGIHYDPREPCLLETMLATVALGEAEWLRAMRLRESLVRQGISKYNVGGGFSLTPQSAGRKVLLVAGQVEGDASLLDGSPAIQRNRDLLATVRAENPQAWIVYKPHPDVVAGNRPGRIDADELHALADQTAAQASINACIQAADAVHVMTSLAGFEALLHGKEVHCHGQPFYAGWGLTVDRLAISRRSRRLSVEHLVYVALCCYPRYRLPGIDGFCAAEDVVAHLAERSRGPRAIGSHWLWRQCRKARELAKTFRFAYRGGW